MLDAHADGMLILTKALTRWCPGKGIFARNCARLASPHLHLNYGDLPTWLTSIATVGALIFAYLAAKSASRIYQLESGRDRIAEQERHARDRRDRRAQAARVAVWLEPQSSMPPSFNVKYSNTSQLPIREVSIRLCAPNLDGGVSHPFLPPTTQPVVLPEASIRINQHITSDPQIVLNTIFSLMSPGQTGPIRSASVGGQMEIIGQLGSVGVGITFNDTEGVRWNRSLEGRLEEVDRSFRSIQGGVIPQLDAAQITHLTEQVKRTNVTDTARAGDPRRTSNESSNFLG
jgi:hypothetical protein